MAIILKSYLKLTNWAPPSRCSLYNRHSFFRAQESDNHARHFISNSSLDIGILDSGNDDVSQFATFGFFCTFLHLFVTRVTFTERVVSSPRTNP
uniref:Uncharacterized protein n=1 Tax=Cucumis melo TaxID=3656 RepID=A0A9I9E5B8_CUCME